MNMKSAAWIVAGIVCAGGASAAQLEPLLPVEVVLPAVPEPFTAHVVSTDEKVFVNSGCKKNRTCDLLRVRYVAQDTYVVIDGSKSFGTRFFAEYETSSQTALERYVFVQFFRGCVYSTRTIEGGDIQTQFDVVRPFFGVAHRIPFFFPEWTVDTNDTDPAYQSVPGYLRHDYYSWGSPAGSFDENTRTYFIDAMPPQNRLYVRDHPSAGFILPSGTAQNVSLEFRMCIYRDSDVPNNPASPLQDKLFLPEPVDCFEWNSSFIYNYAEKRFDSPAGISEVCHMHESAPSAAASEAK